MENENAYAPPESNLETPRDGEPELASRWARLGGALIDAIVAIVVTTPVMLMTGYWDRAMDGSVGFMETLLYGVFSLFMFAVINAHLLAKYGQTVGKKVIGTRIVSYTSNEILPFSKVFLYRYLPISAVGQIPLVGSFLAIIDILFIFGAEKRCVHDLIAGTKVIKA